MGTKEKVLEILLSKQEMPVSGEFLAEQCGISRAAIWKAVKSLRDKGFDIQGTTNGGYVLTGTGDVFSLENLSLSLEKAYPSLKNSHIECFKEIDSTNTYAKKILSENGSFRLLDGTLTERGKKYHNSIIVSECQTAGRGRLGRTFYSPAKTGIYLSVIYCPEGGITEPAKLTAFSAVAVCRVIKRLYNVSAQIKWINDIFAGNDFSSPKKIAGILTEGFTNFETGTIESAVIGIGINIQDNPEYFPEEVAKIAGSITEASSEKENKVTRCRLAAEIAGEVLSIMEEPTAKVIREYKDLSFLIGQTITVHPIIGNNTKDYQAKAIDIDESAGLVVELSDGSKRTLNSGEVSLHSSQF
ncbi:MAG: biotin--[acetyl-CoA-carboxylase] ligase [Treponema sp.]|nr:biotin--[acetyl-CoA-carboxylase] ligase [Treponema sp.]